MPILEHRRIYKAGSSLAITLPRGWTNYHRLAAGDFLEVKGNRHLTLRPLKSLQKMMTVPCGETHSAAI